MSRRKAFCALTVLLVTVACSGSSSPGARAPAAPTRPGTTASAGASSTGLVGARVYFLRAEKAVSVHRDVPAVAGIAAVTLRALLAGPTPAERAAGVSTAVPAGTQLRGLTINGGIAAVDLSRAFASGGGSLSMSARLMQVVYTLTQFATVQRVTFRLEGRPVTALGGEGVLVPRPATRASYADLLPPIFIDSPAWGDTVSSPLVVRGLANVFEGQFLVEVTDATGKVLAQVPARAAMGSHTPFAAPVSFAVTAQGSGRVIGFDRSPKDGSRIDEYAVPVTLLPR